MDMERGSLFRSLPPGLPMPSSMPSPGEVRSKSRGYAKKLFDDWNTLHVIVERHEETIRKRWTKKSQQQRKAILLAAWPGSSMSTQHRPDVEAFRRETPARRAQGTQFKEAYLWPYINLEDLMKPKPLLIFLNSRGRNRPDKFVHSDLELAHLGQVSGATMPAFLNEYTMNFIGRNTPATYGEIVSWDDDDEAFEHLTNGIGMDPGHGLLAMEIQQKIWGFLVACCEQLLRDVSLDALTGGNILLEPGSLSSIDASITSLDVVALEAPYRTPTNIDLSRLISLASAERDSMEDSLWSLREDPSYFAEVMQDYAEHRQEMILDDQGHKHPSFVLSGKALFWNRVLGSVVMQAYFGFATFNEIHQQIMGLRNLALKYEDEIHPQGTLPPELAEAFQNLRFLLDAAKRDIIDQLKMGILPSPLMRPFCSRRPQDPNTTKMAVRYSPPKGEHPSQRLMHLINTLFDDKQLFLFGLHTVTDEIGHLIASDPGVASLVSPWIASRISQLSMVSECLHQLHLFQPWSRKLEDDMHMKEAELLEVYKNTFAGWLPIVNIKLEDTNLYRLADPTDSKFEYPAHRRRNKQNIEKMRSAEANLDALWRAVDEHFSAKARGKTQHDLVAHLLAEDRGIQRTPPWVEPIKSQHDQKQPDYVYQPFSSVFHDPTKQLTGTLSRSMISEKSAKPKTRGVTDSSLQPALPEPSTTRDEQPMFSVDKRTHKVFRALFHSPSNPDLPGEIPWQDFLHAMVAAGFSVQKLHGSAWNFTPSGLDVERSIQFHEPHPSDKIPFLWARRFGRRLNRTYGWTGEMFRLR
ncbi:hypothetical protein BDV96DRAFT_580891 [Lophiotrema nucula]|uniref:Uncharacterized protein n=1 Tax=Lophiotrema nucula TaxID=690887 RepID=A0A6A5YYN8_9PLEO|nr:hypothetical protein BDV96DRAFT_580891 [Lophiotrema nucula]